MDQFEVMDEVADEMTLPQDLMTIERLNDERLKYRSTHCTSDSVNVPSEKEIIGAHCFRAHELLGTGSFGEVYLVEKISDLSLHAMKVLNKEKIF